MNIEFHKQKRRFLFGYLVGSWNKYRRVVYVYVGPFVWSIKQERGRRR